MFTAAATAVLAEGDGSYRLSAFSRKRTEAEKPPEPKKQTYEEMFPSLGGSGVPVAPIAPKAAAGKPTLAEIMRKRVSEEEEAEARKAALERDRKERERIEANERARLRNLRVSRISGNFISYAEDDDTADADTFVPGDLDYDVYGAKRKELQAPEHPAAESSDSSDEDDAEGDEY